MKHVFVCLDPLASEKHEAASEGVHTAKITKTALEDVRAPVVSSLHHETDECLHTITLPVVVDPVSPCQGPLVVPSSFSPLLPPHLQAALGLLASFWAVALQTFQTPAAHLGGGLVEELSIPTKPICPYHHKSTL
jgi:hypothetical protein